MHNAWQELELQNDERTKVRNFEYANTCIMHACLYKFEGYTVRVYGLKKKKSIGFSNGKIREMCKLAWCRYACLFTKQKKKRKEMLFDTRCGSNWDSIPRGESLMLLARNKST